MTWLGNFYRSAIGKKAVMAVTGVILFGWIFLHMVGNLKVYFGPEHFNEYAHFLKTMLTPAVPESGMLWLSRIILLVAVVFHIHSAYALTMMNRQARPLDYRNRAYAKASYASRTMRWGGIIILLFVIYHILHFTTGHAHYSGFDPRNPYKNFITDFRIWWIAAIYIIANLALGLHLYHGVWSMFSSLGVTHQRFENWRRLFATVFAAVITIGNVLFPLTVLLGLVGVQR